MMEETVGLVPVKMPAHDLDQFHEQISGQETAQRRHEQWNKNLIYDGLPIKRGKTGVHHG